MSAAAVHARVRVGTPADAAAIAALAIQVFLDTYATEGVRDDLAREAFDTYGTHRFDERLREPHRRCLLAEEHASAGLLGFAEVRLDTRAAPDGGVTGAELVRLYVQPRWQHAGLGRRLLREAEDAAAAAGAAHLWLTAWSGNDRARAFYAALGYEDVGESRITFQGRAYENRVFARRLPATPPTGPS